MKQYTCSDAAIDCPRCNHTFGKNVMIEWLLIDDGFIKQKYCTECPEYKELSKKK